MGVTMRFALLILCFWSFRAIGGELSDYSEAYRLAESQSKMLLVACFEDPQGDQARTWRSWLQDKDVAARLAKSYVVAILRTSASVPDGKGEQVAILQHPAFRHLHGREGIAMIDLVDSKSPGFRQVVFLYPFHGRKYHLTLPKLRAALQLSVGTLTQRMLIFAVRVHPERPRSTDSRTHPILMRATEKHSTYQARIQLQGHHFWESRFHQLNAALGGGLTVTEVCAESWPGETLVEAAHECVHSWRQSPGHWSAVSAPNRFYGYDMKRGANGIWYGTGIFAK